MLPEKGLQLGMMAVAVEDSEVVEVGLAGIAALIKAGSSNAIGLVDAEEARRTLEVLDEVALAEGSR